MSNCHDYIKNIYQDATINELISKVHPVDLQEDLKQEVALILLNYDCVKLADIYLNGNFTGFVLRIIWNLTTKKNSKFFWTYRKNNDEKNYQWMLMQIGDGLPKNSFNIADKILNNKLQKSSSDAHESIIFRKYVELKSCVKVAEYFGVPHHHINQVVNKVKKELKKAINDN